MTSSRTQTPPTYPASDGGRCAESMGIRILCVDDEPDVLRFLQLTFEDAGYNVLLAGGHDAAIARGEGRERPDLICLDLDMPGKDGYEVLKTLRADPELAAVPVIVVSVSSEEARVPGERGPSLPGQARRRPRPGDDSPRRPGRRGRRRPDRRGQPGHRPALRRCWPSTVSTSAPRPTAVEGLDRLAESMPSVIVLDLMMPVMDGFTFLDIVQRDPVWSRDPRDHPHGHDPDPGRGRPARAVDAPPS